MCFCAFKNEKGENLGIATKDLENLHCLLLGQEHCVLYNMYKGNSSIS